MRKIYHVAGIPLPSDPRGPASTYTYKVFWVKDGQVLKSKMDVHLNSGMVPTAPNQLR